MKKVEINSKVIIKNIETGKLFTKRIKYQKKNGKPDSGSGAYYDLNYKMEVIPQMLYNNSNTPQSHIRKILLEKKICDKITLKKNTYIIIDIK